MIGGDTLWAAFEASWPPATRDLIGPFVWRDGAGGGQRVSAASVDDADPAAPVSNADIDQIEARFAAHNRPPLFQVRREDGALDSLLAARQYSVGDPTIMMLAPLDRIPAGGATKVYTSWPPVVVQREIWAAGGVDAARIAVMERVTCPKTTLLARLGDAPVGAGFVAVHNGVAGIHALEVAEVARRQGMGRAMLLMAAHWARGEGATHVALQVTQANEAARALYSSLGMVAVGQYHYRKRSLSPRET